MVAPSISSRFGLKPRVWSHVQATGPSGFLSHRTRVLRRPARCLLNLLWPFCFLPFVIGPPARSPACAPTALCRLRLLGPATRIPLSPCPQPPLPSHPGGPAPAPRPPLPPPPARLWGLGTGLPCLRRSQGVGIFLLCIPSSSRQRSLLLLSAASEFILLVGKMTNCRPY